MPKPDERPGDDVLAALKRSLPEEWREAPLGWPGVHGWEAENGVVLPEPYRTLIAEVANGSALGPPEDGGLLPLGWLPHDWPHGGERDASAPFPLEQAWFWETDSAPFGQNGDDLIEASLRNGSVLLGSNGDQDEWVLVTAGPLRGRVWLVCECGACPFTRPGLEEHERQGTAFLDWLTYWSSLDGRSILEEFAWPYPSSRA